MKKTFDFVIVSFIDSLEFPVREATRKQIWWMAKKMKGEGRSVVVFILNNKDERVKIEGIDIYFSGIKSFIQGIERIDTLHCINGSVVPTLLCLARVKARHRQLTLTDGSMFWYDKQLLRRCIAFLLPFFFHDICVYSKYQYNRLPNKKNVTIVSPLLPSINKVSVNRTETPSVLFMGHVSRMKGFDAIIPVMDRLLQENPDMLFIICNNMITVEKRYLEEIDTLKNKYSRQIVIKGVVDPIEELSKAWVYIYPFIDDVGTMAFPLSLYEAQCCGVPFVACDVAANKEFFDAKFLIAPGNKDQLYERIRYFIDEGKNR